MKLTLVRCFIAVIAMLMITLPITQAIPSGERCANEGESCETMSCCNTEAGERALNCNEDRLCTRSCIKELYPFCHRDSDCCPGYRCRFVTNSFSTCQKYPMRM